MEDNTERLETRRQGDGGGREGASLVRFYPLDPQSSVLAHEGLDSAGQGGERGVAGITIMLGGC